MAIKRMVSDVDMTMVKDFVNLVDQEIPVLQTELLDDVVKVYYRCPLMTGVIGMGAVMFNIEDSPENNQVIDNAYDSVYGEE